MSFGFEFRVRISGSNFGFGFQVSELVFEFRFRVRFSDSNFWSVFRIQISDLVFGFRFRVRLEFRVRVRLRVLRLRGSRLRFGVDLCEQQRPHARRELGRYVLLRGSGFDFKVLEFRGSCFFEPTHLHAESFAVLRSKANLLQNSISRRRERVSLGSDSSGDMTFRQIPQGKMTRAKYGPWSFSSASTRNRKVDIRLPGKGDSNYHGARPVY